MAAAKKTKTKTKSSGSTPKFGSPEWQAKYGKGKKKSTKK